MQKVPCNECGALILPATAEETGGKCMPCKKGIRNEIEESRRDHQAGKRYDPFRELWVSLVKRSSSDPELSEWSNLEKCYFSVRLLEMEIYGGGFEQYFHNSSANYYDLAEDGLSQLGAMRSLDLLREAAFLMFGKDRPPTDQGDRRDIMYGMTPELRESLTRAREEQVERLDKLFCEDPDHLGDRLVVYAQERDLIGPFQPSTN